MVKIPLVASILIIVTLLQTKIEGQCRLDYSNYIPIFTQRFDSINSVSELSNLWDFHPTGDPGYYWGGGEYYDSAQVSLYNGNLRLTAARLPDTVWVYSSWKNQSTPRIYKSGMIQLKRLDQAPFDCCPDGSACGFSYGMFEIRMKIPKGNTYPAFWLFGPTQFNVYEGWFASDRYGMGFDNEWLTDSISGEHPGRNQWVIKPGPEDLADVFHTYTGVWTPNKITYFFDGREICSFTGDIVEGLQDYGAACWSNSIIVSLQMAMWSNESIANWDIEYIKVFKPKDLDYLLSFKTSNEYMHHDVFDELLTAPTNVSPAANSIEPNPFNSDEVFYRGTNNYIYNASLISNVWQIKRLEFNDGPPSLAAGDIRFLPMHDKLVYVGADNRINLFGRSNVEPCGFYHDYISSGGKDESDKVFNSPGALQTAPNGDIFFRGVDNKMHRYYYGDGVWNQELLNHPNNSATLVKGDIVVDPTTLNVFYRGFDNRLQSFWKNDTSYQHAWIDNNWSTTAYTIKDQQGSIIFAPALNGIAYIGADNKIHLYYWDGSWAHALLPHSYQTEEFAESSIAWDNTTQSIYYSGADERIQFFRKWGLTWIHGWVDDYWNTNDYLSFVDVSTSTSGASIKNGFDGLYKSIFYNAKNGHLSYFKYEPCEILNPPNLYVRDLNRVTDENKILQEGLNDLTLFPNPTTSRLFIKTSNRQNKVVKIFNLQGTLLQESSSIENEIELDVEKLPIGVYIVHLSTDKGIFKTKKFIKL